jgi:hypothetical protein
VNGSRSSSRPQKSQGGEARERRVPFHRWRTWKPLIWCLLHALLNSSRPSPTTMNAVGKAARVENNGELQSLMPPPSLACVGCDGRSRSAHACADDETREKRGGIHYYDMHATPTRRCGLPAPKKRRPRVGRKQDSPNFPRLPRLSAVC